MKIQTFHDLMRLAHGFELAKIFLTANDLDLFSALDEKRTAADVASRLGLDERALAILMNALVAAGLLEKEEDSYRNGALASELLVKGEGYRGNIFKHINHCWYSWNELGEVLRSGHPVLPRERTILGEKKEWNEDFICGMDDVARDLAPQVVRQLDLKDVKVMLDIGGGPGTYAAAFLCESPAIEEVRLLDLPGALRVAGKKLAARGLSDRVRLIEGDVFETDIDGGLDAVWVSHLFHSQNEAGCRRIIEKAWNALNPGGRLMIHEFLLDDEKTSPLHAALFAVHMLVMTEGGRAYSGREISDWMGQQGFEDLTLSSVSETTGVVLGRKPH